MKRAITVGLVVVLLLFCFAGFSIAMEYYEIKEIGENFVKVFWKNIVTKLIVISVLSFFTFAMLAINTVVSNKVLDKLKIVGPFSFGKVKGTLLILVLSIVFATAINGNIYKQVLLAMNSVPFNVNDPIFNTDISYYVFVRPFILSVLSSVYFILIFSTMFIFAMYCMQYLRFGKRTLLDMLKEPAIVNHIAVNIIIVMLVSAFSSVVHAKDVLFDEFAGLTGGGFTDVNIILNYHRATPILIVIAIILVVVFMKKNKIKNAAICVVIYMLLPVLVNLVAFGVDLFFVAPNELAVETKYIGYNIDYTRKAYALDSVVETQYHLNDNATKESVMSNVDTIENIRVIDFDASLTATNQLQGIRNYYEFKDLDVGVYNINGKDRAVALGARELQKVNLDQSAKNYINEKFRYTHGYGVVMMSFNQTTSQGEPYYYIKDINQPEQEGIPKITQPRIYFGQFDNNEVIVNTKTREIDYSEGEKDKEFNYDGKAGIKLNWFNKTLCAFKTGDFKMLIANQITPESRLLLNTNVVERVKKVAPFLEFDADPQLVIADDGSLKWIVDGFSKTDKYPYAQVNDGYNYIRNSVKAVVDAYDGTVQFYIIDKSDPIIMVYKNIYPFLFEEGDMPQSLMSKCVYPESLFNTQAKIYAQYHSQHTETFYNKSDLYTVANEKYQEEIKPVNAYYNLIQLDEYNKTSSELVLMLPYTLYNRENMVSWIAVGNKGDNYGKLVSYKFPKDINIYGPLQIENLIDNDPEISKELTLWNSSGSKVIRGNLMVIPINGTILYVEPVYLTSDNKASIPAVKRVIAACGDRIVMGETIQQALEMLFEEDIVTKPDDKPLQSETTPVQPETESEGDTPYVTDETIQKIIDSYEKLEGAASTSNWKDFGEAMDDMQIAIEELKEKNKQNNE